MKLSVLSRKLVEPSIPTPENLKSYHISFIDQLVATCNISVVLYYTSSFSHTNERPAHQILEESLSKILVHFYPLAGRYIKNERLIDCSDQGVEFIVAKASADVKLIDVMATKQQLDDFLPRNGICKDEIEDPLLSIQLTEFNCGGIAIGVSVSHKIFDGSSLATFITYWANATNISIDDTALASDPPRFDVPQHFPAKNFPIPEESETNRKNLQKIVIKSFSFNKDAIVALKEKSDNISTSSIGTRPEDGPCDRIPKSSRPAASRVRVVSALIARALIRVDKEIQGRPRDCLIYQAVNLRSKIVPPFPEQTCGNLVTSALTPCISANAVEHMGFRDLVSLLGNAVGEKLEDYKEILSQGEAGHVTIADPLLSLIEAFLDAKTNFCLFSDCSKFGFFEANFSWGKPVWVSVGNAQLAYAIALMADTEGSGIEAWVHLDEKSMYVFEQDEEIKLFTSN